MGQAAGYFLPCACLGGGKGCDSVHMWEKQCGWFSPAHFFFLIPGLMRSPPPSFLIISKTDWDIIAAHPFFCLIQGTANFFPKLLCIYLVLQLKLIKCSFPSLYFSLYSEVLR